MGEFGSCVSLPPLISLLQSFHLSLGRVRCVLTRATGLKGQARAKAFAWFLSLHFPGHF